MQKQFTLFGAVVIALVAFCLAVFLGGNPSDAVGSKYKALIAAGVIDAVVEPRELGLDYSREPLAQSLTTDGDSNNLLDLLKEAEQKLAAMPENMPLGIPLGSNKPIRIGGLNDSRRTESSRLAIAIGIVDRNGNGNWHDITPSVCIPIIQQMPMNGGNLPAPTEDKVSNSVTPILFAQAENPILLANASNSFKMARRVPVIDLIVIIQKETRMRTYLIPKVNVNAFDRDVVNAVLTDNLRDIHGKLLKQ